MKKKSFFERLTGGISVDDEFDTEFEDEDESPRETRNKQSASLKIKDTEPSIWASEELPDGQLTVDVYRTPTHIIIKTLVAGVKRDDLDIAISRDSVTIKGKREEDRTISEGNYYHKELYWGSFSRTIALPHEIDIDSAEATENMGMLTIKLPKIDKDKQAKLKVMKSLGTN